ncbi:hypothetical protein AU468_12370 [Alkalispirochaeta sphaeroplastigenens]|uniref:Aminoglycoside phosphotransferase domain-containing protein n=1 Tax=Alkalispirochaeta sphaeroplastigenens TaxID=1187066 RepID=A0A2S4JGJ3_9SPIO|nr:hypothetical protein [Alkalispirochaeta sphaeroplastigenens]POQ98652.1 hypothetical protein AU468_12370 [Alkalispirochaeta sphaeroplastigenens]
MKNHNRHRLVQPGAEIPGLGRVRTVEPLVSFRERCLGKYHRDATVVRVTSDAGTVCKAVLVVPGAGTPSAEPRTRRAARDLREFGQSSAVPALVYVDETLLVLEYLAGTPLSERSITPDQARRVGRFTALHQAPCTRDKADSAGFGAFLERLDQAGQLSPDQVLQAREFSSRSRPFPGGPDAPWRLCFSDTALKNYIDLPGGGLAYIDAFGIAYRRVGAVFIKQVFSLPGAARQPFIEAYCDTAPWSAHLLEHLKEYLLYTLAEQAAKYLTHTNKTLYRRVRRSRTRALALARFTAALDLPEDPQALLGWLSGDTP